jgi:hypothetical protein
MNGLRFRHPLLIRIREYIHYVTGTISGLLLLSALACASSAWAEFPQSTIISSVIWDYKSLTSTAKGSDLWAIAWASDGNQYTIWGDGGGFGGDDVNGRTQWGVARIEGSADNWQGRNVYGGLNPEATGWPMQSQNGSFKVDSMTAVGDVLIAQMINWENYPNYNAKLIQSTDHGRSWKNSDGTLLNSTFWDWANRVDGVGFIPPAFIDMGKGYGLSTDGYVYFYRIFEYKKLYLGRVAKNSVMDQYAYEYRKTDGTWVTEVRSADAVLTNDDISGVNAMYHPYLKRYILTFNSTPGVGRNEENMHDWMMLEGPSPWGPWYNVGEWHHWIDSTYKFQYRIFPKWISNNQDIVLQFSGGHPQDSNTYDWDALHIIKGKFVLKSTPSTGIPKAPAFLAIQQKN